MSSSWLFYNTITCLFRRATKGGGGVLPCPFLKIKKSALILVKKVPIVSILRLNLPFKM